MSNDEDDTAEPERTAPPGRRGLPANWRLWIIGPVVLVFALFHVAPHLADLAGEPRSVLARLMGPLPWGETLSNAAGGWLWEPTWVWLGAMALRLRTLQRMFRDPPGAAAMALIAVVFETGFWIFMGLKQTNAYGPAEASALILMLKIEGAAMLGLVLLFVPLGRKTPGQTDADEPAADP